MRVMDEGMKKKNENRFKALTMAKHALVEWDEVARDRAKWRKAEEGKLDLENLSSWESEIQIQAEKVYIDYNEFQQQKQPKTKNS